MPVQFALGDYLFNLNNEAEEKLASLTKQLAVNQGITEKLKAVDQMLWVGKMNNIRNSAREIVYNDLIYA